MMSDVGRRTSDAGSDHPNGHTESVRRQTSDVRPLILFGGTFDPVHVAHIRCAQAVSRALGHAPVHMMPNAVPPHRPQPGADGKHRMAMLELACRDHPELVPDDRELLRGGDSYTLDTLRELRRELGQRPLVFMVGGDSYADLDNWNGWQEFPSLCHLVVVERPGAAEPPRRVRDGFRAADNAGELLAQPAGLVLRLSRPRLDVSATGVREQLREQGHCRAVPAAVMTYIRNHHLYNQTGAASGSR